MLRYQTTKQGQRVKTGHCLGIVIKVRNTFTSFEEAFVKFDDGDECWIGTEFLKILTPLQESKIAAKAY
jgi:hypothetical protein